MELFDELVESSLRRPSRSADRKKKDKKKRDDSEDDKKKDKKKRDDSDDDKKKDKKKRADSDDEPVSFYSMMAKVQCLASGAH